jgi:hypothetical protein
MERAALFAQQAIARSIALRFSATLTARNTRFRPNGGVMVAKGLPRTADKNAEIVSVPLAL